MICFVWLYSPGRAVGEAHVGEILPCEAERVRHLVHSGGELGGVFFRGYINELGTKVSIPNEGPVELVCVALAGVGEHMLVVLADGRIVSGDVHEKVASNALSTNTASTSVRFIARSARPYEVRCW